MSSEVFGALSREGGADASEVPPLSGEEFREMIRQMVRTRALDERGMNLQRQGRIGFYLPSRGEEGHQIGAALALRPDDWTFPSYRIPGVAPARGADPETLFHQIFGTARDICLGRQMPVHYSLREQNFVSISSPIGTHIPQAVGAAMAMRYRGKDTLAVTWFGDGGTSSAGFHLGLNFAGVCQAPLVFICQNNQRVISLPVRRRTAAESLAARAVAYGMPGVLVDGNDVLAVVREVRAAADRARAGEGPTLVECLTYRRLGHSSSDDPTRYRDAKEGPAWERRDPLDRFERYLLGRSLLEAGGRRALEAGIAGKVSAAVRAAEAAAPLPVTTLIEDVYAHPSPALREQGDAVRGRTAGDREADAAFPL